MSVSKNSISYNFDQITEAVNARDTETIVDALKYGSPLARHSCIVYLLAKNWCDDAFAEPIKALREDDTPVMFELPLSLFAYAYLDKYGIEKYVGEYAGAVRNISLCKE